MRFNFPRLVRLGFGSLLPVFSLTFLNIYKRTIFNKVQESNQNGINQEQQSSNINIKNQNWDWDRIIQIHSPDELSPQDVRQKILICYQMTGKVQIDSQAALIAHLFCDKYFGRISEKFQFIFLTPHPAAHVIENQNFFIVFGKQGSKFVPLQKYMKTAQTGTSFIPNYKSLFKKLLQQVNMFQQINVGNLCQHLQLLSCTGRDTYQLVVIPEDQTQKQINRSKLVLEKFLKNKQIWNSQIIRGIVADHQAKTVLGLNRDGICPNKVYMIAPQNENLLIRSKQNSFKIGSKKYSIIPGQQIPNNFVFTPIPPKLSTQSYLIKVNIDLNQTKPELVEGVYEYLKDQKLRNIPKLLNFSKGNDAIQITVQQNNYDNIIHAYDPNCMFDQQSIEQLLYHSHIWKYPHAHLSSQKLRQFVSIVTSQNTEQNKKLKEKFQYYRSQPQTQTTRKHSKLIVGEQRKQVAQKPEDKVMFHYSKSCHSCKRFSGVYEEIANQKKNIKFYRIDNDTNKSEGLKNYNSTPIFVMYKRQNPHLPWYFKMPYFTKALFTNFVQITKEINTLNKQKFNSHINQHITNQNLVRETLKEIL